jgi:hypothetical protein
MPAQCREDGRAHLFARGKLADGTPVDYVMGFVVVLSNGYDCTGRPERLVRHIFRAWRMYRMWRSSCLCSPPTGKTAGISLPRWDE